MGNLNKEDYSIRRLGMGESKTKHYELGVYLLDSGLGSSSLRVDASNPNSRARD
jgi:hypothetical protein